MFDAKINWSGWLVSARFCALRCCHIIAWADNCMNVQVFRIKRTVRIYNCVNRNSSIRVTSEFVIVLTYCIKLKLLAVQWWRLECNPKAIQGRTSSWFLHGVMVPSTVISWSLGCPFGSILNISSGLLALIKIIYLYHSTVDFSVLIGQGCWLLFYNSRKTNHRFILLLLHDCFYSKH